jgi:hypothetical protein
MVLGIEGTSKNISKIHHISRVNAERIYSDFGSIPTRIIVPEHTHIDELNPIITVMTALKSNYPRRIAEFVADIQTPNTNPMAWMDFMNNVEFDDDQENEDYDHNEEDDEDYEEDEVDEYDW